MIYDNHHDAATYLANTVVTHGGDPFFVREVIDGQPIILDCLALPRMTKRVPIALDDPELNYTNFHLGYMNADDDPERGFLPAIYVARTPARRVQQGLSHNNCVGKYYHPNNGSRNINLQNFMKYGGFRDMLRNNYPSFEECAKILDGDPRRVSVAFHRRFALYKDRELGFYEIHYKGIRVSWGSLSNMVLPTEYCWLREMITETGVNVKEA